MDIQTQALLARANEALLLVTAERNELAARVRELESGAHYSEAFRKRFELPEDISEFDLCKHLSITQAELSRRKESKELPERIWRHGFLGTPPYQDSTWKRAAIIAYIEDLEEAKEQARREAKSAS